MGCGSMKVQPDKLSLQLRDKATQIFQKIDIQGNGMIDKQGTQEFWKSNFAKINTEALFETVDFNKSGGILEEEWMAFWEMVKQSGYTEEEITEEMDQLLQGKAWVKFRRVNRLMQNDSRKGTKQFQNILEEEKKKVSMMKLHKSKTLQSQENPNS